MAQEGGYGAQAMTERAGSKGITKRNSIHNEHLLGMLCVHYICIYETIKPIIQEG